MSKNTIKPNLLWRCINRLWSPAFWPGASAFDYVCECWPEELLLMEIFEGPSRYLRPKWWFIKLAVISISRKHLR